MAKITSIRINYDDGSYSDFPELVTTPTTNSSTIIPTPISYLKSQKLFELKDYQVIWNRYGGHLAIDNGITVLPLYKNLKVYLLISDVLIELPPDPYQIGYYWMENPVCAIKGQMIYFISGRNPVIRIYKYDDGQLFPINIFELTLSKDVNIGDCIWLPSGNLLISGQDKPFNGKALVYQWLMRPNGYFRTTLYDNQVASYAKQSLCIHPEDGKIWLFSVTDGGKVLVARSHEQDNTTIIDYANPDFGHWPNTTPANSKYSWPADGEFPIIKAIQADKKMLICYTNWLRDPDWPTWKDYWGNWQIRTRISILEMPTNAESLSSGIIKWVSEDQFERCTDFTFDYFNNLAKMGCFPVSKGKPQGDIFWYSEDGNKVLIGANSPMVHQEEDISGQWPGISDGKGNLIYQNNDGLLYKRYGC